MFTKSGKVGNVFVPRKRYKGSQRFSFVCFKYAYQLQIEALEEASLRLFETISFHGICQSLAEAIKMLGGNRHLFGRYQFVERIHVTSVICLWTQ